MPTFAIIETGGKQYQVAPGQTIKIEKIAPAAGGATFEKVLLIAGDDGVKIGEPYLKDAKVMATVVAEGRDKKIRVVKYKAKVRYHKVYGHRQPYTKVKIEKIS